MNKELKYDLIRIFLRENGFEHRFTEFGNHFVLKKHDGTKLTIGLSDAEYEIDDMVEAIVDGDENYLISFLDEINGTVTEYVGKDKLVRENYDWMVAVLNSEGKEFLSLDYALEEFDGRAYGIHESVLDDFWWNRAGEMEAELTKAAAGLVDVYHYKGKDWYITPAIKYDSFYIPYLDYWEHEIEGTYEFDYVYIDMKGKTKEAAKRCLEILQKYKREMELKSIPYFVGYFVEEKYDIEFNREQIIEFIQEQENSDLYKKLKHEELADLFAKTVQKN